MDQAEHVQRPLLSNSRRYRDGCPGCLIARQKLERKGYPIKELSLIGFLVLCSTLPVSSLFPYVYFMVQDFHISTTEDIGYYAGIIGSAFMFGRFLTSTFWGIAADKYGRKPVMIISTFALIVFNTMFGLSLNFWFAVLTRFLLGCFNGLLGPIKAYASEVCREENQALALSIVGTAWGIGLIVGPAIGGFLAQPVEKYPNIFSKSSLFGRFPYFLPCIPNTMVAIVALIALRWLPETLHNHLSESKEEASNDLQTVQTEQFCQQNKKSTHRQAGNLLLLARNWPAVSSILIYCVYSVSDMAYSEIFNFWAVSPRSYGGLNLTTNDVGTILSISGFGVLAFQILIFPLVSKFVGPILLTRIPLIASIPLLTVHAFISMLSGLAFWVAVASAPLFRNILSVTANTGMYLLLNNSVPQHQRGFANGVALTLMSLAKAIGPSGGGVLFSWAQKRQKASILPGNHMVFFVVNVITFISLIMTYEPFLPRSLDKPWSEEPHKYEQSETTA